MPYRTPPGPRLAYDIDGTTLLWSRFDGAVTLIDVHPNGVRALNSERGMVLAGETLQGSTGSGAFPTWEGLTSSNVDQGFYALLFPGPTRLYGIFCPIAFTARVAGAYHHPGVTVQTSQDTTNGVDGTWADALVDHRFGLPTYNSGSPPTRAYTLDGDLASGTRLFWDIAAAYRSSYAQDGIGWVRLSGAATRQVRGLRVSATSAVHVASYTPVSVAHIYGEADSLNTNDRLAFWSADSDVGVPPEYTDWGDVPRGSTDDRSFRIKNLSTVRTAEEIQVSSTGSGSEDFLADVRPSSMFVYSLDDKVNWFSSVTIAALSPGAVSGRIWVRRVVPSDAPLSTWSPRTVAQVSTWV